MCTHPVHTSPHASFIVSPCESMTRTHVAFREHGVASSAPELRRVRPDLGAQLAVDEVN